MAKNKYSKYKLMEKRIKEKLEAGDEVTVAELAKEFFPRMHFTDARNVVNSYLHAYRARKKNRFLVYPKERSGGLVQINNDNTEVGDIESVVTRHIGLLAGVWNNNLRDTNNDVVSAKIGFKVGDQLIELGLKIIQDVRQIQTKLPDSSYQQVAGGQESA